MIILLATLLAFVPVDPGRCAPPAPLPVRVVTVYHAVSAETDGSPLVTADGTRIGGVAQRICAVSQDLLGMNGGPVAYGDWLWVDVPDAGLSGLWWVHDTMWDGVTGYVDLLVPHSVNRCWRSADAVVANGDGCPVGAQVFIAWRSTTNGAN